MAKLIVLGAVAILMFLVACGGASGEGVDAKGAPQDGEMVEQRGSFGGEAPALVFEAPAGLPEPEAAAMSMLESGPFESFAEEFDRGMSGEELLFLAGNLEISQRKVISVASVSIEVEVVEAAVTEVRVIAESLAGGFVEQLSSSGEPDRQQAHVTVRVPQAQFFTALERIDALGEVQSRTVGSEDVSEQFIDLEARLKSSLREEQSFLSLLGRTETVGEILTIERELSRVRSEIERLQGRLNFLERRVELATISVSLFPPRKDVVEPPSGALTVEVRDVTGSVDVVRNLVLGLKGSLDGAFLSVNDDSERAEVSLRVFSADFERAIASLEGQGRVRSKELREGVRASNGEVPEEPDASIVVAFFKGEGSSNTWLIVAIATPLGGVALMSLLSLLFLLTYRAGRRRVG